MGRAMSSVEVSGAPLSRAMNHGPVLAFCRSGTRSCNLWALAAAKQGGDPAEIIAAAGEGGYNVAGLLPLLKQLAPR